MSVYHLESQDVFESTIKVSTLTVVHFSADWAAQCAQVTEVLKELSKLPEVQASGIKFYVCDAEKLSEISLKFMVDSVPTVIFFQNGCQVERVDGADASQITNKVKKYSIDKDASDAVIPQKTLEEELKRLINKHKVMVNPTIRGFESIEDVAKEKSWNIFP
ncbi:Glutaredoxin-3 [Eumeta japonica]|uniref:Glutaredoxin-3 n=1 Tax=Eumeta variegata TaxID=151549 RepID=A0A4C1VNJ2_EUMVA|nr:Glutaredoxin-3 [Eumeta japonica]